MCAEHLLMSAPGQGQETAGKGQSAPSEPLLTYWRKKHKVDKQTQSGGTSKVQEYSEREENNLNVWIVPVSLTTGCHVPIFKKSPFDPSTSSGYHLFAKPYPLPYCKAVIAEYGLNVCVLPKCLC